MEDSILYEMWSVDNSTGEHRRESLWDTNLLSRAQFNTDEMNKSCFDPSRRYYVMEARTVRRPLDHGESLDYDSGHTNEN